MKTNRRQFFGIFAALPFVGKLQAASRPVVPAKWRVPVQIYRGGAYDLLETWGLNNPENIQTFERLLGISNFDIHERPTTATAVWFREHYNA